MNNIQSTSSWFLDQLAVFQAANSDYQSIKNNFVIRKIEFETIIESIINKKPKDPSQHELILGRRGSGKSTLLKRIEIEVVENPKLNKKFIAIYLAEEQAGIYRLFDLWEQVLEELKHQFGSEIIIQDYATFKDNQAYTRNDNQAYTRYLYSLIHEACTKNKRRIVLLLDNFDRIVENLSDDGSLLRETLINYNDIQIIAGSTRMDEHFWRYDKPFYEFFRRHRLEALSRDEINLLLTHWSDSLEIPALKNFVKNNPGKIENIRLLTDGLPRTLQFFIQIVLQQSETSTYEYLRKTMDNVSPLFQERLNALPPQLRKVVLEMSFFWEACTTKQLVEKTRMESKLISANLNTLVEKGLVDKIETNKKQHLYRISERFFNMWLIITQGNPEQKRKAKWLSIFLENWYDATDFKRLTTEHIANLKSGKTTWNQALVISKALSQSRYVSLVERDIIIELTEKMKCKGLDNCLIELPEKYESILKRIDKYVEVENYTKAIEILEAIENEIDDSPYALLGFLYTKEKKYLKAELNFQSAIEKGDTTALFYLALLYADQKKYAEAEKYYLLAIEKGNIYALNNLAIIYYEQEKFIDVEKYLLLAVEKGNINAINNLANLYKIQAKYIEAEKYYLLAAEKGVIAALFNLALLYETQVKYSEAEKYYLLAIDKGNIYALNNLAYLYFQTNRNNAKALDYINKACNLDKDVVCKESQLIIEIWNGVFNDVENRIIAIVKEKNGEDLEEFILDLLVQQQKNLVLHLFQNQEMGTQLREKYMVLYYVTLLLNDVHDENLKLNIPPEIQSTIDDVLAKLSDQQRFYSSRLLDNQ